MYCQVLLESGCKFRPAAFISWGMTSVPLSYNQRSEELFVLPYTPRAKFINTNLFSEMLLKKCMRINWRKHKSLLRMINSKLLLKLISWRPDEVKRQNVLIWNRAVSEKSGRLECYTCGAWKICLRSETQRCDSGSPRVSPSRTRDEALKPSREETDEVTGERTSTESTGRLKERSIQLFHLAALCHLGCLLPWQDSTGPVTTWRIEPRRRGNRSLTCTKKCRSETKSQSLCNKMENQSRSSGSFFRWTGKCFECITPEKQKTCTTQESDTQLKRFNIML